jgi:hypothetical protein
MDGMLPHLQYTEFGYAPPLLEFEIKGQDDEYLDLSQSYLQVVCKFTKGDETNLVGGG